jgi:hypothetical protein
LLSTLFVRAARALLVENPIKLGDFGINGPNILRSEPIENILEHGFYIRTSKTSTESSTTRWVTVITIEVRLKSPMAHALSGQWPFG